MWGEAVAQVDLVQVALEDLLLGELLLDRRRQLHLAQLAPQPVRAGQSITFTWSVRADAVGEYEGTAWIILRFVPKGENINLPEQVTGPGSELAVAAIPFDMQVVSLFEMKGSTVRILGTTGFFVCILIALPLLLDRFYRKERHPSL